MDSKSNWQVLKDRLSGDEAKSFVKEISLHHRVTGGFGFHEAVEYVRWVMENQGLEVSIDERPLDGEFKIWTWSFPTAWDIIDGELSVISPVEEVITNFHDTAVSVFKKSKPTPPEGVTAELVYVGQGTEEEDYEDIDVKGKIVLAHGSAEAVADHAVDKYGALGVLTDLLRSHLPSRTRLKEPDLVQDSSIRTKDRDLWAFALSRTQFLRLKELLDMGPVKLKARINSFFIPKGKLETVIAKIPGSELPEEEVVVISHLCHYRPGANDNASGVGLVMEVAKTIQEAVRDGVIPPPKRTITFIIGAEMYGSISYLERNWDRRHNIVGGFCLDMLGEDQEKTKAGVEVSSVPDSVPTYLNDHVATLFEEVRRDTLYSTTNANRAYKYDSRTVIFRYNISQFTPGSDHLIFDDSSVGVPVIQFGHWPDMYYHNSGDTIDMVDPEELKRNGMVFGTALLNMANSGAPEVITFINHVETQTKKRIADNGGRARDELLKLSTQTENLGTSIAELVDLEFRRLESLTKRDIEGLKSTIRLVNHEPSNIQNTLQEKINYATSTLESAKNAEKESIKNLAESLLEMKNIDYKLEVDKPKNTKYHNIIPVRKFVGTLSRRDFMNQLPPERKAEYTEWTANKENKPEYVKLGVKMTEAWSFANGERSIAEIADSLTFEYGWITPEVMYEFFSDLEKTGYVELK